MKKVLFALMLVCAAVLFNSCANLVGNETVTATVFVEGEAEGQYELNFHWRTDSITLTGYAEATIKDGVVIKVNANSFFEKLALKDAADHITFKSTRPPKTAEEHQLVSQGQTKGIEADYDVRVTVVVKVNDTQIYNYDKEFTHKIGN